MDQEIEVINTSATNSIYEDFGVTNAVISGDLSEHEQAMLSQEVSVRDGDDLIETVEEEEFVDDEEETNEEPDGNPEGDERSADDLPSSDDEETSEAEGETSDLVEATEELKGHLAATQQVLQDAIAKGLDPAMEARINEEYLAGEGFSDETYAALEAAGYSKLFVDTFVASQEVIAEKFNNSIISYAGGQESFDKMVSFLKANNESAITAFNDAIDRNDANTLKFVIDTAKSQMAKTFGKRPARQVVAAKPAAPKAAPKVEPFESRADMTKAMRDPRYASDAKYRQQVEQRVYVSTF